MMIDSPQNTRVKLFRSLAEAKHRRETGLFALEGRRLVGEALRAGARIEWVAYSPEKFVGPEEDLLLRALLDAGVEVVEIAPRALAALTHTETPPGIAAVAHIPHPLEPPLPEPSEREGAGGEASPLWLLGLYELRDPGNMGTMIRTAHAFAAAAVVAVGNCVDFYDPKVVRASAGSVLHLPLLHLPNFYALRQRLGEWQAALVVAEMAGPVPCDQADYPARSLLLIGSEAHGLPQEIRAASDLRVTIPMPGGAESLNAAVAAGILAFQIARRGVNYLPGVAS
jgi:TrmH family RNA methyltransferase